MSEHGGGWGTPPSAPQPAQHVPGRIPFSAGDETEIRQTALFAKAAAGLMVVAAFVGLVGTIVVGMVSPTGVGLGACIGVLWLLFFAAIAALLFVTARSLERIVTTDGADERHLSEGLAGLRNYFVVKSALVGLGLLLCCACSSLVVLAAIAGIGVLSGLAH